MNKLYRYDIQDFKKNLESAGQTEAIEKIEEIQDRLTTVNLEYSAAIREQTAVVTDLFKKHGAAVRPFMKPGAADRWDAGTLEIYTSR